MFSVCEGSISVSSSAVASYFNRCFQFLKNAQIKETYVEEMTTYQDALSYMVKGHQGRIETSE